MNALRKLPFVVAGIVGAGLIVVAITASQLPAAKAGDQLVIEASPAVSDAGLERMRADLDRATSVAAAITGPGLSRLAEQAGESEPEFLADLETAAPEFTSGLAGAEEASELADTIVGNLERRQGEFESAASLPGLGLTLRDAVWAQLGLGALLLGIGALGLTRPRPLLSGSLLALGVVLVLVPIALDHPAKAADTDALLDSLQPFTPEKVEARAAALADAQAVFDGFREDVIGHTAKRAGTTPQAVAAELEAASSALSPASLTQTAVILDRFGSLVEFSGRIQPLVAEGTTLPAKTAIWLFLGPGIALAIAGAVGLAADRLNRKEAR